MRLVAAWVTALFLLVSGSRLTELTRSAAAKELGETPFWDDVQDIVFLSSEQPIAIRLRFRVLDEGFRFIQARYATRLFESLDLNADGLLKDSEIRGIPPSEQLVPPRSFHEEVREFNRDPVDADSDRVVTLEELTAYIRKSTGGSFAFKLAAPKRVGEVDLFAVLDANGDRALDPEEIELAGRAILKLDANNDELISPQELSTDPRASVTRVAPSSASTELLSEFLAIDRNNSSHELVKRIIKRYDRRTKAKRGDVPEGDGQLAAGELGMTPEEFASWDADGSGALDSTEVGNRLHDLQPAIELLISLRSGAPSIVIKSIETTGGAGVVAAHPVDGDRLVLRVGDRSFDLSIGPCLAPLSDVRASFDLRFDQADGDNNQYLGPMEAGRLGILQSAFFAVDSDQDGKLFKDELLDYVELEALLFGSRVNVLLSHDPETVLNRIDKNSDYRLGLRELREVPSRLLMWDANGDGQIELSEIPANSQLVVQNGETPLFRRDPARTNLRRTPLAPSGPTWFHKMDRNRDGDVSQREFLGPLEAFSRLDNDSDGLLSVKEANAGR